MRKLLRRLGHVLRPWQFEAELDEELAFHHEMKRREFALKGVRGAGAVDRALGNLTRVKEESREVWIWRWRRTSSSRFGSSRETAASRSLRCWCWRSASA